MTQILELVKEYIISLIESHTFKMLQERRRIKKRHGRYKNTQIKRDDNVWKCKILHRYEELFYNWKYYQASINTILK